jgi:hypothetical protein
MKPKAAQCCGQNSAVVSDAPFLVGVKADGDLGYVKRGTDHQAHWLAVTKVLAPVAADKLTLNGCNGNMSRF